MIESVIKLKLLIVNVFGDAVDLVFAVVNDQIWIRARHYINFAICQFMLENWPLFHTDTNFELVCWNVLMEKKFGNSKKVR